MRMRTGKRLHHAIMSLYIYAVYKSFQYALSRLNKTTVLLQREHTDVPLLRPIYEEHTSASQCGRRATSRCWPG